MKLDSLESATAVQKLEHSGYVVIDGFLSPSFCDELKTLLDSLIRQDLDGGLRDKRDAFMVHNPMLRHESFYQVLKSSILTQIISQLLGDSFILYAFTTSSMPAGSSNWSRRIHVDCPRLIPGYPTNMNAFVPLSDTSEENGGIELLPGSQWINDCPSESHFRSNCVIPTMSAGSLLLFYSRLWHSGGLNSTNQTRHALTMNFCRSFMRQRFDYPRMIPSDYLPQLDNTQRQLLGFNVRVPTSLDEYYLPESDRLYKPHQG